MVGGRLFGAVSRGHFARDVSSYQWHVLGVAGVVAFGLGCWGFCRAHEGVTDMLYKSFTLFVLSGPAVEPLPWQLDVARFLAPAVAGFAGLNALRLLMWDRLQQMRIPMMRNHVVVCGLGYVGTVFVRHLREEGHKVVAIEADATNTNLELCRRLRVPVIAGDAQQKRTLRAAGVDRAARLLAVCNYDAINAEIVAVAEQVGAERSDSRLHCLARINDPDLCRQFRIHASRRSTRGASIDFLNIDDIAAQHLLERYPIPQGCERPHILVAHLDPLGQWLIVQAALEWLVSGLADKNPLHITVLDDNATLKTDAVSAEHPYATSACAFRFAPLSAEGIRGALMPTASVPPITCAYVTAFRDEHGLETALKLHHQFVEQKRGVPVIAALSRAHGVSSLVRDDEDDADLKIKVFQTLKHVCTTDIVEAGLMETKLARNIHDFWRVMAIAEGRKAATWDETAEYKRESSRALARDIPVKLRRIGCRIASLDGAEEVHRLNDDDKRILARDEHNRWWKEKIATGWTYAEVTDDDNELHADMKPYEQLTPTGQDKDKGFIENIPTLLLDIEMRIVDTFEVTLARRIHDYWTHRNAAEGRDAPSWELSLAQAREIPGSFSRAGFAIVPARRFRRRHRKLTTEALTTIARDRHNRWWKERIAAGWTYAPDRNDAEKKHPNIKPFDELDPDGQEPVLAFTREIPKILASLKFRIVRSS